MADKDILEFIHSSKNLVDADSDDENKMTNVAHVIRNEKHHEKYAHLFRRTFHCYTRNPGQVTWTTPELAPLSYVEAISMYS
ncbi:hypothetical protein TNCV_700231 [Trichonephila clavipes]|nr:hypothetical protein TNCV_700231 [Trichonephila clavipes]